MLSADSGEAGVFRKETVTRMNRIGICDFCSGDDTRDIQIRITAGRRADTYCFISKTHVQTFFIGSRVNCNSANTHLLTGTDNPQSNFSTIGNQNFLEHTFYWV